MKKTDDRFQNGKELHERWMRLPTTGRCPTTGLTRPHFYLLIGQGEIKSAVLRRPGCTTGVRLVWLPSVMQYIERHVEKTGVV
jgi:hypothetical protein